MWEFESENGERAKRIRIAFAGGCFGVRDVGMCECATNGGDEGEAEKKKINERQRAHHTRWIFHCYSGCVGYIYLRNQRYPYLFVFRIFSAHNIQSSCDVRNELWRIRCCSIRLAIVERGLGSLTIALYIQWAVRWVLCALASNTHTFGAASMSAHCFNSAFIWSEYIFRLLVLERAIPVIWFSLVVVVEAYHKENVELECWWIGCVCVRVLAS